MRETGCSPSQSDTDLIYKVTDYSIEEEYEDVQRITNIEHHHYADRMR